MLSDYVLATGTANAIAIAPTPAITAYVAGQQFSFKAIATNTGATTLNVSGLGTKNVFKNGQFALNAGDIKNGSIVQAEYDGTQFQLLSQSSLTKISQTGAEIYGTSTTGTTAYVVGLIPVVSQYIAGLVVNFIPDTGGGHATLNVNSLGAKNIFKNPTTPVSIGDIVAFQATTVMFDGTQFQLQSKPNQPISFASGATSYDLSTASGTQNIPHGLGVIPSRAKLTGYIGVVSSNLTTVTSGTYDGTSQACISSNGIVTQDTNSSSYAIYFRPSNNATEQSQTGVITFDRTNIIITWTKLNSPSGTARILWEAQVSN